MIFSRYRVPAVAVLFGALLIAFLLMLAGRTAHADPVVAVAVPPDILQTMLGYAALVLACGIAASALLGAVAKLLHAFAARTTNTMDDAIAAGFDAVHTKLDNAIGMVRSVLGGMVPPPPAAVTTMPSDPPTAPDRPAAKIAPVASLVVLALCAIFSSACGPKTTALAHGLWDCLAPERAEAVSTLTPLAESVILAAASADGKLIDASKLRAATSRATLTTEAGILLQCAMASAVTALLTPTPAAPSTGSAELVLDPAALRDAWARIAPAGQRFLTAHGEI